MLPLALGLLIAVALVALGVWLYRRYFPKNSGRDDRYEPQPLLTAEQLAMLDYLHDSFPGQEILVDVRLSALLGVRRASDRQRAVKRLDGHRVDYVVCSADGRAVFAFDVEQYHLSNAKAKAHKLKLKNRMLKTAGVRFVFLKNGIHRMPSPNDFRRQLDLAELPRPIQREREPEPETPRQQLESHFSQFDQLYPTTGFRDSDVLGLSGLMELGPQSGEAPQRPSSRAPEPAVRPAQRPGRAPATDSKRVPTLHQRH